MEKYLHFIEPLLPSILIIFHVREIYVELRKKRQQGIDFQQYQIPFKTRISTLIITFCVIFLALQYENARVFELIHENYLAIFDGIKCTFLISSFSIFFGSLIGIIAALLITQKKTYLFSITIDSAIMSLIYILLGIPALVLLYLTYYGLNLLSFWASIVALSINLSPFVAKIVIASIMNISQEHIDSAHMFGYSPRQITRYFKIDFVVRNSLQPLLVEYYTTIKLSSFAGLIGLWEIYHVSQDINKETQNPIASYIILAICYVLIVTPFAVLADFLEHEWKNIKS